MMKQVKVSELTGRELDYAVAVCEDKLDWFNDPDPLLFDGDCGDIPYPYEPSCNWEQGGEIIERERLDIAPSLKSGDWFAWKDNYDDSRGSSILEAAMRCYVRRNIGSIVDIPEEL